MFADGHLGSVRGIAVTNMCLRNGIERYGWMRRWYSTYSSYDQVCVQTLNSNGRIIMSLRQRVLALYISRYRGDVSSISTASMHLKLSTAYDKSNRGMSIERAVHRLERKCCTTSYRYVMVYSVSNDLFS